MTLRHQVRWMTAKPDFQKADVLYEGPLYEGPLGKMITRLKLFSLTSAFLGTVGLPVMMVVRGMDIFEPLHLAMVTTTIAGSWGSTFGLDYIFSPYVHTLERIPIRQCDYVLNKEQEEESKEEGNTEEKPTTEEATTPQSDDFLLKATTRSLFARKVEHVFNPETDVKGVPGGTIRPFCSFLVKEKPLYIHEEMIHDPKLFGSLFVDHATAFKQQKNPDPDDDEFL